MATKYSVAIEMENDICCTCGMPFGTTLEFKQRRRNDGEWFYCPAGHPQRYSQSEVDRLRLQVDEQKRKAEFWETKSGEWRERSEKMQADLLKQKQRTAKGVCPCCNRSFANSRMTLHIKTKHPNYAKA